MDLAIKGKIITLKTTIICGDDEKLVRLTNKLQYKILALIEKEVKKSNSFWLTDSGYVATSETNITIQ